MTPDIVFAFANSFCALFCITFLFSRLKIIKDHLTTKPRRLKEKIILALLFGALGCVGSSIGVEFSGSLINTRVIGVAVGGLLGGPLVGVLSGLIAGLHRILFVKAGAATALVCGVSMVFEGAFAGLLSRYSHKFKRLWVLATLTVILCELFRKLMLLLFIQPFDFALLLVKNMTVPMLVINSLGVALFITFIENVVREKEVVKASQLELVLAVAENISTCFKQGLLAESLAPVIKTMQKHTGFSHIIITNTTTPIVSNLSAQNELALTLPIQKIKIKPAMREPFCEFTQDGLFFIATPLIDNAEIAGFLVLGQGHAPSIYDCKLATGLGKLFSTQLTIGNLEYRSSLLREAEIKVLQTQINPHFLFNSLTVVSSLCRTDPQQARSIIDHLAEFYRKNLRINDQLVSLQDEIAHIEAYLEIIKVRYAERIQVRYDIDEALHCYLPPLSLQPLVENSIKHGLLPKRGGGVISIRAKQEADANAVKIEVEDDGQGFDLNKPPRGDSAHIGLSNVQKRLSNCFGSELSWKIDTQPNKGTKVTIVIPAVEAV